MSWSRQLSFMVLLVSFTSACASADDLIVNVLDCGANPDGATLCTEAIQKAIDRCATAGGGTVRIPPGGYLSGAIRMKSGVTLRAEADATLLGSRNREDYYGPQFDADGNAVAGSRVFRNLIHGENLDNITICGKGVIDGNGSAFRDKTKARTKSIYFNGCRNVLIEDVQLRNAGCWMQHYRFCQDVTIRNISVFNHVAFNNDGLNIDSCQNVTISDCHVDSDDDAIVLKSLSNEPCHSVAIRNCTISSHCNALKMGTESGGGFVDISISKCQVTSPQHSEKIYGRQRGLAGIALEIVDGGRLENVTVSDVDIEGVSVPIFLRLGNRARPYVSGQRTGVGTFRKVRLHNITARSTSSIGCSISGLPGHPIEDVELKSIRLHFDGGGTREDSTRAIPERETSYPESTMFGTLPAYGFYCRHARGLRFTDVTLDTNESDLRHALVFDDVEDVQIEGLDAQFWPGAAAMLRLSDARRATIRNCSPQSRVDTLLKIAGATSDAISLQDCHLENVEKVADLAAEVRSGAFQRSRD